MKKVLKMMATMAIFCVTILVFIACDHNSKLNSQIQDESVSKTPQTDQNINDEISDPDCCLNKDCHCAPTECEHNWQPWIVVSQGDETWQFYRCAFDSSHLKVTVITPSLPLEPVDPVDPVEPVDPVVPEEPLEPVDPVDPFEPEEPVEPVEPENPIDPTPEETQPPFAFTAANLADTTWVTADHVLFFKADGTYLFDNQLTGNWEIIGTDTLRCENTSPLTLPTDIFTLTFNAATNTLVSNMYGYDCNFVLEVVQ